MIKVDALCKDYGPIRAVDQVSFEVAEGDVLGFLGPNGAGKSTTMKMIAGFLRPTSGSATVCGHDVIQQPLEAKRQLGYLPEGAPSYGEMTAKQFLAFVADLRGLRGKAREQGLDGAIARLALGDVLHQPIETLSKGFRRRVGLAQAVLHDPKVLILDEPTDGLDPNQKHEVRNLIRDMASDKIIVISTHILEEVDAVCNRAIIISNGQVLADDSPAGLERQSRLHNAVRLRLEGDQDVSDILRGLPGVASVERDDEGCLVVLPDSGQALYQTVASAAAEHRWAVAELHVDRGRLDDVFREITTKEAA